MMVQQSLSSTLGPWAAVLLAAIMFLLAFTSVLGNYSYGEANVLFISDSETLRKVYAAGLTGIVFLGSIISVDLAWAIAGVTMVIIAMFNLLVIMEMGGTAVKLLKHYQEQKRQGLEPVFLASDMPELVNVECWSQEDMAEHLARREEAASQRG